jgi:hypothetical protein
VLEPGLIAINSLLPLSLGVRELGERAEIAKYEGRLAKVLLHGLYRREGLIFGDLNRTLTPWVFNIVGSEANLKYGVAS